MKIVATIVLLTISFTLNADSIKPVWPLAPEKARVAFEGSITKAEDLEIKKGFFARIWESIAGEETQSMVRPFGIHIDDDNKMYITDVGTKTLFIFDKKNGKKKFISGTKREPFLSPVDVATDKHGNIYVSDSARGYIYVFNKEGDFLKKIGENSHLKRPVGIVVNQKSDRLYVVDTASSDIKIFSINGATYIKTIGKIGNGDGEFNRPTYLTIDSNGDLYVCDTMNHRIQVFDRDGNFIKKLGKLTNSVGSFANPRGIAIDSNGYIYVSDTTFNAIQIFNKQGELMLIFGSYGKGSGEFAIPEDLVISKNNMLYVADSYNMRVQLFKLMTSKK